MVGADPYGDLATIALWHHCRVLTAKLWSAIFLVCVVCSYKRKRIFQLPPDFTFSAKLVTHVTNDITAVWFECKKKKIHLNSSHDLVHVCGISGGGTQITAVLIQHAVSCCSQVSHPT